MAVESDAYKESLLKVDLNDEQSIINLLTSWDKKVPSPPKDDILDGRRLCGDVYGENGQLLDGSSCVHLLQKCLITDDKECILS